MDQLNTEESEGPVPTRPNLVTRAQNTRKHSVEEGFTSNKAPIRISDVE